MSLRIATFSVENLFERPVAHLPRKGPPSIAAAGRADGLGWVELEKEAIQLGQVRGHLAGAFSEWRA